MGAQGDRAAICDVTINVLGYIEDGEWCALALEMDLRGYGSTFEEALEDLSGLVVTQISFAQESGNPDMPFFPADTVFFELFAEARREALHRRVKSLGDPVPDGFRVAGMPVPSAHLINETRKEFATA